MPHPLTMAQGRGAISQHTNIPTCSQRQIPHALLRGISCGLVCSHWLECADIFACAHANTFFHHPRPSQKLVTAPDKLDCGKVRIATNMSAAMSAKIAIHMPNMVEGTLIAAILRSLKLTVHQAGSKASATPHVNICASEPKSHSLISLSPLSGCLPHSFHELGLNMEHSKQASYNGVDIKSQCVNRLAYLHPCL